MILRSTPKAKSSRTSVDYDYLFKQDRRPVHGDSGSCRPTTPSLIKEVDVAARICPWFTHPPTPPKRRKNGFYHPSLRLHEPAAKSEVRDRLPRIVYSHARLSSAGISVGLLAWLHRAHRSELASRRTSKADVVTVPHLWRADLQRNVGTVLGATSGRLLKDEGEARMDFSGRYDAITS